MVYRVTHKGLGFRLPFNYLFCYLFQMANAVKKENRRRIQNTANRIGRKGS